MTEKTVLTDGEIDRVSDRNAGRIGVIVFCAGARNAKARSAKTFCAEACRPREYVNSDRIPAFVKRRAWASVAGVSAKGFRDGQ
jgi:hypothetical protein